MRLPLSASGVDGAVEVWLRDDGETEVLTPAQAREAAALLVREADRAEGKPRPEDEPTPCPKCGTPQKFVWCIVCNPPPGGFGSPVRSATATPSPKTCAPAPCTRCGGSRLDPEHEGLCGACCPPLVDVTAPDGCPHERLSRRACPDCSEEDRG